MKQSSNYGTKEMPVSAELTGHKILVSRESLSAPSINDKEGCYHVSIFISLQLTLGPEAKGNFRTKIGMEGVYLVDISQPTHFLNSDVLVQYDREHIHFYEYDVVKQDEINPDKTEVEYELHSTTRLVTSRREDVLYQILQKWSLERIEELVSVGIHSHLDQTRVAVVPIQDSFTSPTSHQ